MTLKIIAYFMPLAAAFLFQAETKTMEEQLLNILIQGGVGFAMIVLFWRFLKFSGEADKRRDGQNQQLLTLIASQQARLDRMDSQAEASEQRFVEIAKQNTDLLEIHVNILKAMDERANERQRLLQEHDQRAAIGIADIIAEVKSVGSRFEKIDGKIDALTQMVELKFPTKSEWDERVNDIRQELREAVQKLKDCADKVQTDEHSAVSLLDKAKEAPEDAAALTPGAESEAIA